jgi:hypothetical protein
MKRIEDVLFFLTSDLDLQRFICIHHIRTRDHEKLKRSVIDHFGDGPLEDGTARRGSKTLQVTKHPAEALEERLSLGGSFAIRNDLLDLVLHSGLVQHQSCLTMHLLNGQKNRFILVLLSFLELLNEILTNR